VRTDNRSINYQRSRFKIPYPAIEPSDWNPRAQIHPTKGVHTDLIIAVHQRSNSPGSSSTSLLTGRRREPGTLRTPWPGIPCCPTVHDYTIRQVLIEDKTMAVLEREFSPAIELMASLTTGQSGFTADGLLRWQIPVKRLGYLVRDSHGPIPGHPAELLYDMPWPEGHPTGGTTVAAAHMVPRPHRSLTHDLMVAAETWGCPWS
jgi:hypothetical protein